MPFPMEIGWLEMVSLNKASHVPQLSIHIFDKEQGIKIVLLILEVINS